MPAMSVILPAKNEARSLENLLPTLIQQFAGQAVEIIVVNDGSTDHTLAVCQEYAVTVVTHPYPMGNGAAIKTGARHAQGEVLVFMDADSQHQVADVVRLLARMQQGFDMVVGARNAASQASFGRLCANTVYNRLSSWMVGHPILDLTSGLRVANAKKFKSFLYLLPNGFSYPTTITMAFFRAGYAVGYEPITTAPRIGKSHIRPLRDAVRFFLIIFRIGTLFSPFKLFVPVSAVCFTLGLARYGYTYLHDGRFTNMSALLFIASLLVFLMGLISEQITHLLYSQQAAKPEDS